MNAVDSNILVYAHRDDAPWHIEAKEVMRDLAEGSVPWAIPWPCLYEFFGVVTHARRYQPPSSSEQALAQIAAWLESPPLVLLSEPAGFMDILVRLLRDSRVTGPPVHDARIAALCHYHGIDRLYTADRDFSRFGNYLRVENPLLT